jgi:calcineurin-like phosphoesterase family protein
MKKGANAPFSLNKIMMFFISDTHFFHKNILKYSNRPFASVEAMNEFLIKKWNNIVSKNSEIYHLGDFAFCKDQEFLELISQLNGKLTIILGNHDKNVINNKSKLYQMGVKVFEYKEVRYNNNTICLFHYGQRVWNKSHHGSWHLYGHSHGKLSPLGKSVDVGVDAPFITGKAEYRPFSIEEISEYMKFRQIHDKIEE